MSAGTSAVIRELRDAQSHVDTARDRLREVAPQDRERDRRYAQIARDLQHEIDSLQVHRQQ